MFQEIGRRFESIERNSQETDRKFQETIETIERNAQETDRKFQETDRRFQETDRKFQESGKRFEETECLIKEVNKETNKKIGDLGNRLGQFVQEMVRPGAVRLFRKRGINVHEVYHNVEAERNGNEIEIDLLVVNDNEAIAVECKSNLSNDDVNEHLERLAKVKTLLPKYHNSRIMGAVAAMVIPNDVARYAYHKGLFVLAQSGENMIIRNDDKFSPKIW